MKKILSLVLVIAMVLSSFSFAFAAEKFEDTEDFGDYEEAIYTLVALGVIDGYDDGTYKPERTVTRAEMAKLIVEILGYGDLVSGSASEFIDTQGHWADAWISLAAGRGLVIGTGGGNFTPDRQVSYDEAITMVVRALGYTDDANEFKGMTWPTNFKSKANDLKLLDGVKSVTVGADRGGVAQLLFNALDAALVTVSADGDVMFLQDTVDGVTVNRLLLTKIAIAYNNYNVTAEVLDPDNKKYAGDMVDIAPYMFQNLNVYLNGDDEVVYVKGTNSLVIEGVVDDIDGLVVEVKDADGKIQKAALENNDIDAETVFENGALKESDIEIEDLSDTDTIKIVADDKNDNGKIDAGEILGFVTTIKTNVIRVEQEYVDGRNRLDTLLLPDKVTVKGDAKALAEIEEDDIVAEYLSEDKTVTTLVVTRDVVEGKATRLITAGDKTEKVYIEGVEYDVAGLTVKGFSKVELGAEGVFFLNHEGDVVDFDGSASRPSQYAIVLAVANGDTAEDRFTGDIFIDKYPSLRLATQDGKEAVYDIKVDITKAGLARNSAEDQDGNKLVTEVLAVDKDVVDKDYLIKFKLNKDDRISEIEAVKDLEEADTYREINLSSSVNRLASDTIIFDASNDYAIVDENKLPTKVEAYLVRDSNGNIEVIVVNDLKSTASFVYVKSVDPAYNNGNNVQIATVYTNGEIAEVYTTDTDTFENFKEGVYEVKYDGKEINEAVRVETSYFLGEVDAVNADTGLVEVAGKWLALSENGTVIEVKEILADGEHKFDSLAGLNDINSDTIVEVYENDGGDIDLIVIIPVGKDARVY